MPDLCRHRRRVCSQCVVVTDAARRAYDVVNGYVGQVPFEVLVKCWVGIRLADGSSDGVLYDDRGSCVRHQSDEKLCAYFSYRNSPNGFGSRVDAQLFMDYHRMAYDQGFRLPDPGDRNGGPELIMPTAREQIMVQRAAWAGRQN